MKMLTEGRLADSVWRVEDKDYSNAAARRPFISCMLHRVSLLLAQSGHAGGPMRARVKGLAAESGTVNAGYGSYEADADARGRPVHVFHGQSERRHRRDSSNNARFGRGAE